VTHRWTPKSVLLLKRYSGEAFVADLLAGVTVGLVALPLAMAFAISSGVTPQAGIYWLHASGRALILCGAPKQPAALMEQAEFHDHVGARNICPNIKAALERAAELFRRYCDESRLSVPEHSSHPVR